MRRLPLFFASIACLLLACASLPARAEARRVLVLYSLGNDTASLWQRGITRGLNRELAAAGAEAPHIYEERLDAHRTGPAESSAAMEPYLRTKYARVRIDAVIAENYPAGAFLDANPDLFPGAPRFYVNHGRRGWTPSDGAGFETSIDYARLVDAIPQAHKGVRRIVVVGEQTARSQEWIDGVRALAPRYQGRIVFETWDNQSFAELYQRTAALGPTDAVLMFATYGDNTGAPEVPPNVARKLAGLSRAPVFTHVDSLIVGGVAGGYVLSAERIGQVVGRLALGRPADTRDVQHLVFDYPAAQRFGLTPPEGAQWLNRERGIWELYRLQILCGVGLIVVEAVLIWALVLALRGRRQSMRALHDERNKLEEHVAERTLQLRVANSALEQLATTDALTGIGNRRRMTTQIAVEIERARRFRHSLSLLMIDIDHFKRINDAHGHDTGDRAIAAVARTLSLGMRSFDMVARFGGEEFVVLMPETDREVAAKAAARLRAAVAGVELASDSGQPIWMTISVGVAAFHPDAMPESPSALLSRADKALYQAKAEGRDRVVCA